MDECVDGCGRGGYDSGVQRRTGNQSVGGLAAMDKDGDYGADDLPGWVRNGDAVPHWPGPFGSFP